jgi:plastocyanin
MLKITLRRDAVGPRPAHEGARAMIEARGVALGVSLAVVLAVTACGESGPATSVNAAATVGTAGVDLGTPSVHVTATDLQQFSPATQTAHVGDIVQWTNTGTINHTVTFDSFSSLSDLSLQAGATWEVKFTAPGTYPYRCTIHAGMTGTLVVS